MAVLRFSAARDGALGNALAPWKLFGEDTPGVLEGDARKGVRLDQIFRQTGGLAFSDQPAFKENARLAAYFDALPDSALGDPDGPVVIFVHGFMFEVRRKLKARLDSDNPHRRLFHFDETGDPDDEHDTRATPWLARALCPGGIGDASDAHGLAVCFGYASYGETVSDESPGLLDFLDSIVDFVNPQGRPANFYALAYIDAMIAGHALAAVLVHLARRLEKAGRPNQRIDIMCHSLGARTVMKAIEALALRYPAPDKVLEQVGKVILLAGACLWEQAGKALDRIDQADPQRRPEFFNVLSRADEVVRVLGSRASLRVAREEAGLEVCDVDRTLALIQGAGLLGREGKPPQKFYPSAASAYADWVDIDLHKDSVKSWGHMNGFQLDGDRPVLKGDHWVHFTHRPNWELYRKILADDPGWSARELAASIG
ncbi:MAG: hypothetical protein AAGD13_24595 [Pseudomonadota bacterium]